MIYQTLSRLDVSADVVHLFQISEFRRTLLVGAIRNADHCCGGLKEVSDSVNGLFCSTDYMNIVLTWM